MAENGEKGKLLSPALMGFLRRRAMEAVSYTHLTLPTTVFV